MRAYSTGRGPLGVRLLIAFIFLVVNFGRVLAQEYGAWSTFAQSHETWNSFAQSPETWSAFARMYGDWCVFAGALMNLGRVRAWLERLPRTCVCLGQTTARKRV